MRAIFEPAYDWQHWRKRPERLASLYTPADRAKAHEIEMEARKLDRNGGEIAKGIARKSL